MNEVQRPTAEVTTAVGSQACSVCGRPIDPADAVLARGDVPEQWVHDTCYIEFERRLRYRKPATLRERMLSLFERAKLAGRIREPGA
jgi:hypothetical protein